ncbi:Thioesterase/thiol ester dehydrase-isomerase [Hypoxylon argillaceum]|nr:Thioesterase/thiol ester dehydrase-isomerase [Hypoxylon argillaceum]KAI1149280.1 Thioesterase/thiol ester dehydrase-isomerase [Nemania diffusa]
MTLPSAEDVRKGHGRLAYQEALSLISLPDNVADDGSVVRCFMSQRRVWITGEALTPLAIEHGISNYKPTTGVYGGHVYSQASLAVSLAFRAGQKAANNGKQDKKLGIHTIHGFFSEGGADDRPFIYRVTNLASNAMFPNFLVTASQPTSPSTNPEGDHYLRADADLPLGPVRFSAIVSFRPSGFSQVHAQELAPQVRFAEILSSRRPIEWDPAPITDVNGILAAIPGARQAVGLFPGLEMRKVDMRAYNANRPLHERRDLVLYRLLAPLPATYSANGAGEGGECAIDGPDAHICAHAYAADRNGLLMIGNHVGFGRDFARAASLSYSLVVHVNAEDAVMAYAEDDRQWWVQEHCFPRVEAGRGIVHCKIWSPEGVHVATEYQDGIIRRKPRAGDKEKGKL